MKEQTKLLLEQYARRAGMIRANFVEELVTAFLARHGIDPDLAQVVQETQRTPEGGCRVVTWIERRAADAEAGSVPRLPEERS